MTAGCQQFKHMKCLVNFKLHFTEMNVYPQQGKNSTGGHDGHGHRNYNKGISAFLRNCLIFVNEIKTMFFLLWPNVGESRPYGLAPEITKFHAWSVGIYWLREGEVSAGLH